MTRKELFSQGFRLQALIALLLIVCIAGWGELTGTYGEIKNRLAIDTIRVESRLLSEFNHAPTAMSGAVIVPDHFARRAKLPIMFHFPGFGADSRELARWAEQLRELMAREPELAMVHVYMDPSIGGGYSYFTDSPNNGPWAAAFVSEFIPALEQNLSSEITPGARYLTGHSSGGWTAVWMQIHEPREFSGVWATGPDPLDFSDFFGVDIGPDSKENFYIDSSGASRPAARSGSWGSKTLRQYVEADERDPRMRGDLASYEWAFSSKGADGAPLKLFDRGTGALNQAALIDWQRFDLRNLLASSLPGAASDLREKLHIWVGEADEYFLDRPTKRFCSYLAGSALGGSCVVVPQRGHKNLYHPHPELYPKGLLYKILTEAARRP